MFHEITLKLYFMKCPARKISQCILPFMQTAYFYTIIDIFGKEKFVNLLCDLYMF